MTNNYDNSYGHLLQYWLATSAGGGSSRVDSGTRTSEGDSDGTETSGSGSGTGTSGSGGGIPTSPEGGNIIYGLELENLDKVVEILNQKEKIRKQQRDEFTVVPGNPDFLPSSTLLVGAKLSLAVCRIVKKFSIEDFHKQVKELKQSNDEQVYQGKFNSPKTLQEIFSIPDKLAQEIFSIPDELAQENSHKHLEELLKISQAQLDKLNPIPWGTGFLVGGTHLLTNHHVIPTPEIAEKCLAEFNYLENTPDSAENSAIYEFDPKSLFISNPGLDYTLVQLKSDIFARQPGYHFGWIQLLENEASIAPGLSYLKGITVDSIIQKTKLDSTNYEFKIVKLGDEEGTVIWHSETLKSQIRDAIKTKEVNEQKNYRAEGMFQKAEIDIIMNNSQIEDYQYSEDGDQVIIVQHPKGKKQKIVLYENKIIPNGLLKNFLRYEAKADYGSSGSPVFNTKWELVALHHAAIPRMIEGNNELTIFAQQGIRICRIIEDLKKKSFSDRKLRNFIEDFVITSEKLNNPPFPSALELDGLTNYVVLKDINKSESVNGFRIEAFVCPYSNEVESTIVSKFYQNFSNDCIATLGYDALRVYINKEGKIFLSRKMYTLPSLPLEIPQENTKKKEFIFNLQSILKILSYSVVVNGVYDNDTKRALQEFVKDIKDNIKFDPTKDISEIDPQILNYLNSQITFLGLYDLNYDALEQLSYEQKDLKIPVSENPSEGEIVKGLQSLLKSFGCYDGKPDGEYNKKTCAAVKQFQKACGLKQDGVAGPLTQKMMTLIQSYEYQTEEVVTFGQFNRITITCSRENEEFKIDIKINGNSCKLQLCQISSNEELKELQKNSRNAKINFDITQDSPIIIGAYSNKNLALPDFPYEGNLWSLFRGAIAKISLWNIGSDKNDEKLLGEWQFEEVKGSKLNSFLPTDNIQVLEINGEPKWLRQSNFPAPLLPSALKFDDNSYVDCGNDESLNVTDEITVEAWFKHKFGNCLIVSRVDSQKNGYSLSWYNGKICVALQKNQDHLENTVVYTKENAPQDQVWHHVAFTWDQKSKEISIYIDGRIQDCVVEGQSKIIIFADKTKSIGLFAGSLQQVTESLIIGCQEEKETYYSVAIADVRLWKVARTQDAIKANMSQRLTGKEENLLGYWRLDDVNDKNVSNLVNKKPGKMIGEVTCFPLPAASPTQTAKDTNVSS